MPTPVHWLILCSTSAKQMPLTNVKIEEINTNIFQNGRQNVPTTYQERCGIVKLNDSLVNVPITCQQRCEIKYVCIK